MKTVLKPIESSRIGVSEHEQFNNRKQDGRYTYRRTTSNLQPVRHDDRIVFLDHHNDRIEVGNVCLQVHRDRSMYVESFEVNKPIMGFGYGREIYKWVEAYARRRGMRRITLIPYDNVVRFWSKMGFNLSSWDKDEMVKVLR